MKKLSIFSVLVLLVVWGCKKSTGEGQQTAIPIQTTLLTPANDAIIPPDTEVQFTWKSTSANTKDPISSKIKIVEIIGDQTPVVALRTNKPIFERDSGNWVTYVHPKTGLKFLPAKTYAWMITAKQSGGKLEGDDSAPSTFKIR